MANNNHKPRYEKISIWVSIVAGIFTILGITVLGSNGILNKITDSENVENLQSNQYHRGTIHDNSWESKFIGLRYTALDGMSMSTEEELNTIMEFNNEILSKSFSQEELGYIDLTTVLEMKSEADTQPTTVGVCVERMIEQTNLFQVIETFESQFIRHPYINYTLISDDESVKIGNDYYTRVSYIMENSNHFLYMDSYFRIVDDRVIMITITFDDEAVRDDVLDAFTAY